MWEFYLAGSEAAFRSGGMMVFQIQIARNQLALPLTRDYIFATEEDFRERERAESLRLAGE
jgi:cyclopropane-fatty-acyl-phospholipid synthase